MAKQIKATLKGYFETGKVPSQAQYADLIDSNLNLLDTTTQTIVSPVNLTGNLTASANISASGTGSFGELEVDGDVFVSRYIRHTGDRDTHIEFLDNKIQLHAGNLPFITIDKDSSTPRPLTINNGGNRINFRVQDKNSNLLLKADSEAFKVNLYHSGNQKLETAAGGVNITGEVTASGNISSSGVLTAEGLVISDDAVISDTLTVGGIFQSNGINLNGNITASGNISSSNIIAETGSFNNGIILKAPNGNQFRFTVNNSGHLSLTGSAV